MGKTQSKLLAAWHGRGTAWEQYDGMCELAFIVRCKMLSTFPKMLTAINRAVLYDMWDRT
jgi:hypothetical protein